MIIYGRHFSQLPKKWSRTSWMWFLRRIWTLKFRFGHGNESAPPPLQFACNLFAILAVSFWFFTVCDLVFRHQHYIHAVTCIGNAWDGRKISNKICISQCQNKDLHAGPQAATPPPLPSTLTKIVSSLNCWCLSNSEFFAIRACIESSFLLPCTA